MPRAIAFLGTLLSIAAIAYVLLGERSREPAGPPERGEQEAPDAPSPARAPELAGGASATAAPKAAPSTAAFSSEYFERKSLIERLRSFLPEPGSAMDTTQSHRGAFREFGNDRRAAAGKMGRALRDIRGLPENEAHREALTHIALSALEGMAPLGKVDGGALASLLMASELGDGVFHARALRVLGDHAPDAQRLTRFLVKLLLSVPDIQPEVVAAIHELARQHEGLLESVSSGLVRQHRGSVGRLHDAMAAIITDERILRFLAAASGRGFAGDRVDLRDTLLHGLRARNEYVRMLAASALHEQALVEPVDLWPVVSASLKSSLVRVRTLAVPLAGDCAPNDDELQKVVTSLLPIPRGVGVALAIQHLARFDQARLEGAIRRLPLRTRQQVSHSAAHTHVAPPLREAQVLAGKRFFARVLLSDVVASVRRDAVFWFRGERAVHDLIQPLKNDPDPEVAAAANRALSRDR